MVEKNKNRRIGVYPGTFDPITKGHLHIIRRASKLVDHLVVAVGENVEKKHLFSIEDRLKMVEQDILNLPDKHCSIEVQKFDNLLVDFAKNIKAVCVFRGLRAVSDFDYEFQMTGMNARLNPDVETVFLMASDKWQFVSSSFIKEIHRLGGDVCDFVTPQVKQALIKKRDNSGV